MKPVILLFFICACFKINAQNIPGIALKNSTFIEETKVFKYQGYYFLQDTTGHWIKVSISNVKAITSNIEVWPDRGGYYNDMYASFNYLNSSFNYAFGGALLSLIGGLAMANIQNLDAGLVLICVTPATIMEITSLIKYKKGLKTGKIANIKMTAPEYTGRK